MKEVTGNIWDFHSQGEWIGITTNGDVGRNGDAIMGAGVALQAKEQLDTLPLQVGMHLQLNGNVPGLFHSVKVVTFPTKNSWSDDSDLTLIRASAQDLMKLVDEVGKHYGIARVYLPQPGTGFGNLTWDEVKPVIADVLDDRFIIVAYEGVDA